MNGQLRLKTAVFGGKTVAEEVFFTPPFKLYSPFYENGAAKFVSMCAAAGTLAGDDHRLDIEVGSGCNVHFTDQGFQKLFNTNGKTSSQTVNIRVGENASLIYLPHPVMTFGGCDHTAVNCVEIKASSSLIFAEIYCCGRTAMGEEFALKRFRSRTEIRIDGKADFIDNTLIEPERLPVKDLGFFEGYTHTGILYAYSPEEGSFDKVSDMCAVSPVGKSGISCACSRTERGVAVRVIADSGESVFDFFNLLSGKI